jgi:DNA-binding NtrC family response regulator
VGSAVEAEATVRVLAATNRDLLTDSIDPFRSDLYYRLNVLRIDLPPLRARLRDIPELVDHFLRSSTAHVECSASPGAIEALMEWHWPGNVRELKHCVERTLVRCSVNEIESFDLGVDPGRTASFRAEGITTARLVALLHRHSGRLRPVAEELGVSARTVQRHMSTAGLRLRDYRSRR